STVDRLHELVGERGDAAHPLHQVEDDALAGEQGSGAVADDGDRLALLHPHAVEDLGMTHHLEATDGPGTHGAKQLQKGRDAAHSRDDAGSVGDEGRRGAQPRVDRHLRGDVVRCLILGQSGLEDGPDSLALPIHAVILTRFPASKNTGPRGNSPPMNLAPQSLSQQFAWIALLAMPIASIAWTVTHEEVFREPREFCKRQSESRASFLIR